jgi:ethanolamine utilization protein EutQ (cupin superfamily)
VITGDNGSVVTHWKEADVPFSRGVGADGGPPMLGKLVEVEGLNGGYLDFKGGVLAEWKQPSDEMVFVVSGQLKLTHHDTGTVYDASPGDLVFMRRGHTFSFAGGDDARIAYVSGGTGAAAEGEPAATVFKADEIEFPKGVGQDGGAPWLAKLVNAEAFTGGYLDFHGGVLNWTEPGDEIVFVIRGRMTLTRGDTVYECSPGDVLFIRKGSVVRFEGEDDTRIAYVATA